jgi:hypothetical protein
MNSNLNLGSLSDSIKQLASTAKHYYGLLFFVLVAGIYLFLIMQTNTYVNIQPDESSIKADTAKKLRVDENVAEQLQKLRDNSVNVQSIPSDTRNNPFQE